MSPGMLSMAKSSKTEPTWVSPGSGHDSIIGDVRDRTARSEGCQPRAAPAAQDGVNAVAVKVGGPSATTRRDALGEHLDHRVEVLPREVFERRGAAHQRKEIVFGPIVRPARGHDLLGEDVERTDRWMDRVEPAAVHAPQ